MRLNFPLGTLAPFLFMLDHDTPTQKPATRAFGRFELRQLLGKSERTMVWLAFDPRSHQELILTLPRAQPAAVGKQHPHRATVGRWRRGSNGNLLSARSRTNPIESSAASCSAFPRTGRRRGLASIRAGLRHPYPQPAPGPASRMGGQAALPCTAGGMLTFSRHRRSRGS